MDDKPYPDDSPCLHVSLSPCVAIALVVYGLMTFTVVWSLLSGRKWALAELSRPQSVDQWQEWREDVREQETKPGPVRRRVPKSAEPPALVLMRDYFGVSLVGAVVFTSVLYWVIAWLVMGILRKPMNND